MASNMSQAGLGGNDASNASGVSVGRLYQELIQSGTVEADDDGVRLAPDQLSEEILSSVTNTLFNGESFSFEESVVKGNLDEILVLLVALRESETHGKGLMEDLATVFDSRLSPGTVYPRLHDLEEEGVLCMQELVRTKEYRIEDEETTKDLVESAMHQHLALGFFFYAALGEL